MSFRYLRHLAIFVGIIVSAEAGAFFGGATGRSTPPGCDGGCHGIAPGTYDYTGTVERLSGATWSDADPSIDSGGSLSIRFYLTNNDALNAAPAGGFNLSATGGTLLDSSATIDDNSCGCGELTHTAARSASGGLGDGDINFDEITWGASTSESGSFAIRACGLPVSQGGDGVNNDGPTRCDTMTVSVRPVINNWTDTVTYDENTQNGAFVTVDGDITISGSNSLDRVESSIETPFAGDDLACPISTPAGISCSSDTGTSIVLSGAGTRAEYEAVIRGIRFRNTSENPDPSNRTVRVRVRDSNGGVFSNDATKTIDVNPQNDAPTISGVVDPLNYNENAPATEVDTSISLGDLDNGTFASAEVNISTGCQPAEDRLEPNASACSANGLTCIQVDNCSVTITGTQPIANYALVLQAITYRNLSSNPDTGARAVRFRVQDSSGAPNDFSADYFKPITVIADSDPPSVAGFTGTDPATTFVEQTDVGILAAGALSITDPDSSQLNQATIQISGGSFEPGDSLACSLPLPGSIDSCNFSGSTLIIGASAGSALADFEDAIENVVFNHLTDDPTEQAKQLTLVLSDIGSIPSASFVRDYSSGLDAVNDQGVFTGTNLDTGEIEGQLVSVDVGATFDDPDDDNNGTNIDWSIVSGLVAGMSVSSTGVFNWTPPLGSPPATFGQRYDVTVQAMDGLEDGTIAVSRSFRITIDPPDGDSDLVADYEDFCVSVASVNPGENFDFDEDGIMGTDGRGTPGTAQHDNSGGDVCDDDDDNDGMTDAFEQSNSLNPFGAADAFQDADGDGISNLQEFLDGTNPNLANLVIDATGYWTPFQLIPPLPTSIHPAATAVTADDYGPYRPGDNTITWTPSNATVADLSQPPNDVDLVSNPSTQPFQIRPLASFAANQQADESGAITVEVTLNGDSPSWPATPATVDYSVSGTASYPADHDAASGIVVFNNLEYAKTITFTPVNDGIGDPDETVVFTMDSATNAAIGAGSSHTVTLVEGNIAPEVEIEFTQGGGAVASVYTADGGFGIGAVISDVNQGQIHSFDWSGSDNSLTPPGDVQNWPGPIVPPAAGNFVIDVIVTDNGLPARSTRVTRILNVTAGSGPGLDSDGDGIPDSNDNFDGIANAANLHLIDDQTVNAATSMVVQTDPGLKISIGNTARAANSFGVLLTDSEIERFGSGGGPPLAPDDNFEHVGGIYDFEIGGLIAGSSARVVIPLLSGVPKNAEYRKFDPVTGWGSFVADARNRVSSAPGAFGACPEPGSDLYVNGLHYLFLCLQLTIEDGGPNDADGAADGKISDPGAIGVGLTDRAPEEVESGGGRMSSALLLAMLLLGIGAMARHRRSDSGG